MWTSIPRFVGVSGVVAVLVVLALLPGSALGQGREAKWSATGSAKTEAGTEISLVINTALEHASFSAQSVGIGCNASGSMTYRRPDLELKGKIVTLVVQEQAAFLVAQITSINPPTTGASYAWFDVFDSQMSGGTGDLFRLEFLTEFHPGCLAPLGGNPITRGNIIVQGDTIQPLP